MTFTRGASSRPLEWTIAAMPSQIESLQFVLFTRTPPAMDAVQAWRQAFDGTSPDNFQKLPNGGTQAGGLIGGFAVTAQATLNRIDVIVAPPELSANQAPRSRFLDKPGEGIDLASGALKRIAPSQNVHRPAVVIQAAEEHRDAKAAVEAVRSQIKGLPVPEGTIDVNYQVNVPCKSNSQAGLIIQRLARWYSGRRIFLQVDQNLATVTQPVNIYVAAEYVDVFGDPNMIVAPENFDNVLDEVIAEARRILAQGYGTFSD